MKKKNQIKLSFTKEQLQLNDKKKVVFSENGSTNLSQSASRVSGSSH